MQPLAILLQPEGTPDTRIFFAVNVVVVVSVVLFAFGVVVALLKRSYQRRLEEEKLEAVGGAAAWILHQIKNPLQTVVLHADLLQAPGILTEDHSRREVCEAIVGESQRLVAMLNELSEFMQGKTRIFSLQPLALHDLVRQVAGNEQREALGTGLKVDTSGIREATIQADDYYLRQVLENLVRNAREAMEAQEDRRLALSVERVGPMAAVRVADNGPGIPVDRIGSIFQPFFSTKGKGMGLGLAICKEIVEGHGGRLEVQSLVREGTTFTILLPLAGEAGALAEPRTEAAAWS